MDYLKINKENWNKRTEFHTGSAFYNVEAFLKQPDVLNSIELDLLGEIKNKTLLHLQCHFGMDTLSLAGRGAVCTGIDLSDKAITEAKALSEKVGIPARFIESDVYGLPAVLSEKFDIVFTSYGTVGWLPDINKWAAVVANHMRSGSVFVMADFHPFMWTFDDNLEHIAYDYFNSDAIVEKLSGSYADPENGTELDSVGWNHGMAEIISALLAQGLELQRFEEHDWSPYQLGKNWIDSDVKGKYRPSHLKQRIPLVYGLRMQKP